MTEDSTGPQTGVIDRGFAVPAPVAPAEQRRVAAPRRVVSPIELVERARERDRRAFEALYRLQFPSIARQVAALVRDPDRAEDAVAQTFLLAWKDLPQLRRADRFDSWLARIAHHQAINELRRPRTAPLEEAPEAADQSEFGSPSRMLDRDADVDRLRIALLALPSDQRTVLMLRFLRDLPHVEVARLLGRSQQATRALQYRALRAMHRVLGARDP